MLTKPNTAFEAPTRAPGALITLDANGCFTYVNNIAGKILNRYPADLTGKHIWTEFPELTAQSLYEAYEKAVKNQQDIDFEEYNSVHDRWLEYHLYPLPAGTSIFLKDITEQKRMEEDNRRLNLALKKLIENIPDAVFLLDLNYCYTDFNQTHFDAMKALYGKEIERGTCLFNYQTPEDKRETKAILDRALMGESFSVQINWGDTAFSRLGVELILDPVYNYEGIVTGLAIEAKDTVEYKKTKEALIESELYLHGILDATDDGILAIGKNGKVITTNNRFAELWRIPPELIEQRDDDALLGYVLDQLINPEMFLSKVQELYHSDKPDFDILYFKDNRIFERYSTPLILDQNLVGRVWSFRNVTDQKAAEMNLKLSEKKLRQILSSTADVFYVIDRNYCISLISDSAKRNLLKAWGKKVDIGVNILPLIPDEKEEPVKSSLEKVFTGEKVEYMLHLSSADLPEWELINLKPVFDNRGDITGAYIVIKDITERKQAEDALRESEALYRSILKASPDDITITDLEGKILVVSPSAVTMFGYYSEEEILGRPLVDFVAPEDISRVVENISLLHQGVNINPGEYRAIRKDKSIFPIEVNADFIRDFNGLPVKMIIAVRDISERKLVEDTLTTKTEQLERTGEIAKVGGWEFDLRTKKRSWSSEICRILELDTLETPSFENELNYSFYTPESAAIIKDAVNEGLATGNPYDLELQMVTAKGRTIWVREQGTFTMEEGKPVKLLGVIQDITERKKTENAVQLAQQSYFDIFNSVSEAIYILDETGSFIDVNKGAEEMYLFSRDELIGQTPASVAAPGLNNLEHIQHVMQSVSENGIPVRFDFWAVRKNGEIFPKEVIVNRGKYFGKDVLIATARDMTERKQAEEALLKSKLRFQNLVENISGVYWVKDLQTNLMLYVSPSYEIIFGRKCEDLYRDSADFIHAVYPEDKARVHELFKKVADSEKTEISYRIVGSAEEIKWILVKINAVTGSNGKKIEYGYAEDITERIKAEEKIKKANERFELIGRAANEAIWEWNLETDEVWGNEMHQQLYGLTPADPVPVDNEWRRRLHPEDREQAIKAVEEALASKQKSFDSEYRFYTENMKWLNVYGSTFIERNKEGKPIRLLGSMRNVTEHKKAEDALRESEETFRRLFYETADPILLLDDTGFADCNQAAVSILGYSSKQEVLNKKPWDLSPEKQPDGRLSTEKAEAMIAKALQQGYNRFEWVHTKSDGTEFPVEVMLTSISLKGKQSFFTLWRDIAERKKAEEQLRVSEETQRLIMNSALDAIVVIDTDSFITVWTPQAEKIFGWTSEEVIGKNLTDIIIPASYRVKHKNGVEAYLTAGKNHFLNRVIDGAAINKEGREIPIEITVAPIKQGNKEYFCSFIRDISERKKAEKEVNDYKFALDQSSIVDVSDSNGTIQYANENFCRISGYSIDELRGKNHRILKSGYHSREHYKDLWNTVLRGKVWRSEVKNKAKDGSLYWVDTTIVPFLNEEGKPFQFITIRSDITKRKEAETSILDALNRYDILSNATSDTIWDWDVNNDTMIYNQGLSKKFGYRVNKIKSIKEWWDTNIYPDDRKRVNDILHKSFAKRKQTIQMEYRFRCADGTYKYVFDRGFVIYDDDGKPVRMIGSMQDVTSEKEFAIRIENEVIDAQEREWNQIGMELHDNVNQILAASMLLMGLGKEKMEKGEYAGDIIQESEKHVGEAIAEIRRLSHQLAPVSVDNLSLDQVFESLIEAVNIKKQFKVKLQINGIKGIRVPHKLQINLYRILQAQLNNIMKHAKATEVIISLKKKEDVLVFRIADNGIGFDAATRSNGIGLENIKRRAKVFYGESKLNTAPGKGCEIVVEIPVNMLS